MGSAALVNLARIFFAIAPNTEMIAFALLHIAQKRTAISDKGLTTVRGGEAYNWISWEAISAGTIADIAPKGVPPAKNWASVKISLRLSGAPQSPHQ
jgi:hypothetical protein